MSIHLVYIDHHLAGVPFILLPHADSAILQFFAVCATLHRMILDQNMSKCMLHLCFASRISKGMPLVFVRESPLVSHSGMDISPFGAQGCRDMYLSARIGHPMSVRHRRSELGRSK
jgi:hypothetical protein